VADKASDGPGSLLPGVQITGRTLLVVEGQDEKLFFDKLIEQVGWTGVQVLGIGGKTRLPATLKALVISPGFSTVAALGIVRDADVDPIAAFQSVCGALMAASLPVPSSELQLVGDELRVAVMITPGDGQRGQLEDLCLRAVGNTPAMPCVDRYFGCLQQLDIPVPGDSSKAKVQVFLASKPKACLRVGEAACAGYWPFEDPAFDQIRELVESLVAVAEA
jgi:hypothetical protein